MSGKRLRVYVDTSVIGGCRDGYALLEIRSPLEVLQNESEDQEV